MLPLRNRDENYIAPGGLPRSEEATWYRVVGIADQTVINTNPVLPNTPIGSNAGQVATLSADSPCFESKCSDYAGMFYECGSRKRQAWEIHLCCYHRENNLKVATFS